MNTARRTDPRVTCRTSDRGGDVVETATGTHKSCNYTGILLAALTVCTCTDPRSASERAQSPPEPTRHLELADSAGAFSGTIQFASGMTIDAIRVTSPLPLQPGQAVAVSLHIEGDPKGCHLGVRPPRASARQVVPRGDEPPHRPDSRIREVDLADGDNKLELPTPWHPSQAVVDVQCPRDPVVSGPRTDDGRGLLAMVPVVATPTHLAVEKLVQPPMLDGKLDEAVWHLPGHELVTSLEGEPDPDPPTRVWAAWDTEYLYFAADLPDTDIWTEYRDQDDPLYRQDVFEVFVAGDNSGSKYLEYQVSARNVTFDAAFPRYRKGDEAWDSTWRTAVNVRGTLDGPVDRDQGWTAEVAIAWTEICAHTTIPCPPQAGTRFRTNVFRIERPGRRGSKGLALTPTRKPDFHAWQHAATVELVP